MFSTTNTAHATYNLPDTKTEMLKDAPLAGIMYDNALDPDIRSLRQTIVYGLKGISAYGQDLIRWTMRTGEIAIEVMKKLVSIFPTSA